jgi:hypothetical protein
LAGPSRFFGIASGVEGNEVFGLEASNESLR